MLIRDTRWINRIRDGKNSDPGINIPDPKHWKKPSYAQEYRILNDVAISLL
jgi:hypothetical protein